MQRDLEGKKKKTEPPVETLHLPNSLKSLLWIIFNVSSPTPFWSLYTAIKGNMKPRSQGHHGPLIIQIWDACTWNKNGTSTQGSRSDRNVFQWFSCRPHRLSWVFSSLLLLLSLRFFWGLILSSVPFDDTLSIRCIPFSSEVHEIQITHHSCRLTDVY